MDAAGVTGNAERVECGVSINRGAIAPSNSSNIIGAGVGAFACTPSATYTPGDAVQFYVSIDTGAGAMDDRVDILSVAFSYQAS